MGAAGIFVFGVLSVALVWSFYVMRVDPPSLTTELRFEPYQQIWSMFPSDCPVVCGQTHNATYICDLPAYIYTGAVRAYGMHEMTDDLVSIHCTWKDGAMVSDSCVLRVRHPADTLLGSIFRGIIISVGFIACVVIGAVLLGCVATFGPHVVLAIASELFNSLTSKSNDPPAAPCAPPSDTRKMVEVNPECAPPAASKESEKTSPFVHVVQADDDQIVQIPVDKLSVTFLMGCTEAMGPFIIRKCSKIGFYRSACFDPRFMPFSYHPEQIRALLPYRCRKESEIERKQ